MRPDESNRPTGYFCRRHGDRKCRRRLRELCFLSTTGAHSAKRVGPLRSFAGSRRGDECARASPSRSTSSSLRISQHAAVVGAATILIERAQGGIGNFGITELARGIHQHRVSAGIARFVIAEVESLSRDRKPLCAGLIGLHDIFQILSRRGPHSLRAIGRETILESREARISRGKWETNSG